MKLFLLMLLVTMLSATAFAETYKWEDKNGVHFTDNPYSIPQKYRKKAIAEARGDITTDNPDVARDVSRSQATATIKRQQDAQREAHEAREGKKREDSAKLAKTVCTGIPGECGPGRSCVYDVLMGKRVGNGICMDDSKADRVIAESNERRREIRQQMRDQEINNKLDRIDRNIRYGY